MQIKATVDPAQDIIGARTIRMQVVIDLNETDRLPGESDDEVRRRIGDRLGIEPNEQNPYAHVTSDPTAVAALTRHCGACGHERGVHANGLAGVVGSFCYECRDNAGRCENFVYPAKQQT
jgi:hypothetical protein